MAKKKLFSLITTISLAIILLVTPCLIKVSGTSQNVRTTTIEVKRQAIDYQSVLDEFENAELETEGSLTTFVGYKSINLADLNGFDLVSETDVQENTEVSVKYNFSYDNETNIVTLSAELKDEFGEIQVDTLYGAAFINEYGEIDAVMNVDGEGILLSEMKDAGLIANCGWFSRLFKKVVTIVAVAAIAVVTVTAAVATAGAIVAAAAAAAPAVVAVSTGTMAMSAAVSTIGSAAAAGFVAAGSTALATSAAAAATIAGVAIAGSIAETIIEEKEEVKEKTISTTTTDNDNKKVVIFPVIPETFMPKGLIMKEYAGTSNGRFIKWFDSTGTMIFEWDEDLLNGSHYHIMVHDGIHYLPGSVVPEPYASLYF